MTDYPELIASWEQAIKALNELSAIAAIHELDGLTAVIEASRVPLTIGLSTFRDALVARDLGAA